MRFRVGMRKAATSLVLIVLVALGARMAFAWSQARKMPPQALGIVPFQNEAGNIAAALAEGRGFSDVFRTGTGATAWLAPVYPVILGAIFRVFGIFTPGAFFAAAMFNILCSAAACVPIFRVGKRIWGLGAGAGAAWLWAIFPNGILLPFEWVWDTSLTVFWAAAILWATLEVAESEAVVDWCGYGALWGLALLTSPALGAVLPFLLAWMVLRGRGANALRWKRAGLALGVAALCCVPWTARNVVQFRRLIPVRSNLPFELWLGNNDIFDEHAVGGRRVLTRREEAQRYTKMGENEYMAEKGREAAAFIEAHPGLEVRLSGRRFLDFWVGTDAPVKNFLETDRALIRVVLVASGLTAIGALAGMVALWWKARIAGGASYVVPLAVFPVAFPLLYYATHADLRYRHPIDPAVMLLTVVAIAGAWEALQGETKKLNAEGAGKK